MKISVRYFGVLKRLTGADVEALRVAEGATVSAALGQLVTRHPGLEAALPTTAVAIGDRIVTRDERLSPGDELALLPPVSGGTSARLRHIVEAPIDTAALVSETEHHGCGALIVFEGVVRNVNDGKPVDGMTYEAHVPLAERILGDLEREVEQRFDVPVCRIVHRIGELKLGEASVVIVVRSAHRKPAFRASEYAIDELKARAPIWKHEHYIDGESQYLDGTPLEAAGKIATDLEN